MLRCVLLWWLQFERTLIIAEDDSEVSYLEGCTAPSYDSNQVLQLSFTPRLYCLHIVLRCGRECENMFCCLIQLCEYHLAPHVIVEKCDKSLISFLPTRHSVWETCLILCIDMSRFNDLPAEDH
jgi:hypothetical protein